MAEEAKILALNDELLVEDEKNPEEVKRNTKEYLIEKILAISDENDLELSISNTKLKRMSKDKLKRLLAELAEKVSKEQIAKQMGASDTSDRAIGLATLRMVHNLCAVAAENGLNQVLPKYGYEVDGFQKSLQDPTVSQCVDDCLLEISQQSDILQYVESPYARLGIAWSGCLMTCVRACPKPAHRLNNVTRMGPKPAHQAHTLQPSLSRRPQTGQKHSAAGSPPPNAK